MDNSILGGIIGGVLTLIGTALFYFISIGRNFEKIDRLEKEQERQEKKIDEFSTDIATLKEFKANTEKIIDKEIYKSKSPLVLTDLGKQLIEESGFNKIFEEEKDNLVKMLEEKNPQTQYDVQELSRQLMSELTEYAPFQNIKTYAFEHGKDYTQILRAGAIPLRDYFLEKHKEIAS